MCHLSRDDVGKTDIEHELGYDGDGSIYGQPGIYLRMGADLVHEFIHIDYSDLFMGSQASVYGWGLTSCTILDTSTTDLAACLLGQQHMAHRASTASPGSMRLTTSVCSILPPLMRL
jgi:hypothetical protein